MLLGCDACCAVGGGLQLEAALIDVRPDVGSLQPSSSSPTVAGCRLGGFSVEPGFSFGRHAHVVNSQSTFEHMRVHGLDANGQVEVKIVRDGSTDAGPKPLSQQAPPEEAAAHHGGRDAGGGRSRGRKRRRAKARGRCRTKAGRRNKIFTSHAAGKESSDNTSRSLYVNKSVAVATIYCCLGLQLDVRAGSDTDQIPVASGSCTLCAHQRFQLH